MTDPLLRFRNRLIAWHVGVFAGVLLLFGITTLLVVEREITSQLDRSLAGAVDAIERASIIREEESASSTGAMDAFDELHIPGRDLYVFDATGTALHPPAAPAWIAEVARRAAAGASVFEVHEDPAEHRAWRVSARTLRAAGTRRPLIGVAIADNLEVEQRYPRILLAFAIAGTLALLLVALGGVWLARRASGPAESAFEQMRRFTADAAHQLRTPLSVIRSRGEIALRRHREPDEYRAALRDVVHEAGQLGGVVEKLLLLARADAGEVGLRRERVYLDDVVEEALVTLGPVAREHGIGVDLETPMAVPVHGDATLLGQLVGVLVDNAIQFSPPNGRVRIHVGEAGGHARLTVTDDGPGIPPEERALVFERFYRAHPTRGRGAGAGLGLAIGRWIAEAHGGRITLEPGASRGTCAIVDLPTALPTVG